MMIKVKTLRMPDNLSSFIIKNAKEQGLTQNALILKILWDWYDNIKTDKK